MTFFDFFKKRSTFPENDLEQEMLEAASDIAAQKRFYQKLLWSELIVLSVDESKALKEKTDSDDTVSVKLMAFETGHIPIFTSLNRIADQKGKQQNWPYLSIKGMDLFEFAKGAAFILNPFSEYSKELVPEEIDAIMNGTIYDEVEVQAEHRKKIQAFNDLYERGGRQQEGLIFLDGYHQQPLRGSDKRSLEASVNDFQACLELFPDHWQSQFLMAKSLQRLGRHAEALEQLEKAFELELENHSIPLEAATEAMFLSDFDKALFYSEAALTRQPNDPMLMGNYAMNLLIAQKDEKAQAVIAEALALYPKDPTNKNVAAMIRDVAAGKRRRPTFEETI